MKRYKFVMPATVEVIIEASTKQAALQKAKALAAFPIADPLGPNYHKTKNAVFGKFVLGVDHYEEVVG